MSEGTIQPQLWYLVEKFFTAICAKFKKNQSISSISSLVVVAYAGACQGCGGSSVPAGSGGSGGGGDSGGGPGGGRRRAGR